MHSMIEKIRDINSFQLTFSLQLKGYNKQLYLCPLFIFYVFNVRIYSVPLQLKERKLNKLRMDAVF